MFRSSLEDVATAQRQIEIAKQRGMRLSEIISHDILQSSHMFDFDLPAKTFTSRLFAEIEQHLS